MITFTNRPVPEPQNIRLMDSNLPSTSVCKFLGLKLDQQLCFSNHIDVVVRKTSKLAGILYRIRDFLPLKARLDFYYALIYPYLSYGVSIWGSTGKSHLEPLVIQQKRIIRIISGVGSRDHTSPLFYRLKLFKLTDIHKYHLLIQVFEAISKGGFTNSHNLNTRNSNLSKPVFQRLSKTQQYFCFVGPSTWNELPCYLRGIESIHQFKKRLKIYLVDQYKG